MFDVRHRRRAILPDNYLRLAGLRSGRPGTRANDGRCCGHKSTERKILRERLKACEGAATTDVRALPLSLGRYREPNHGRSTVEILITVVPFVLLWLSMWLSLRLGYGLYLLLAIPTACFLVRLFMIQHDCGHGSFFRHRFLNDWLGRVIGVFTLT